MKNQICFVCKKIDEVRGEKIKFIYHYIIEFKNLCFIRVSSVAKCAA
jgi:hypothetical protein